MIGRSRNAAPRQRRAPLAQKAQIKSIPAPTGGWNARDALSDMKLTDAIRLDNLIPGSGGVELRKGFTRHSFGLNGYVETLVEFSPPSGDGKFLAATPTAIYDVTAPGVVGAAVQSGLTNGRWQTTMFGATGNNFLCMVNGADGLRTFDATSSWVNRTASITGVDAATFSNVAVHASRLWFTRAGTLDAWYLPVASVQGAAKSLPLGPLCELGGELIAIGSWTHDGGNGPDDYWVGITSKGQVVVYQGTDPDELDTWSKVGTFRIAEPVGKRCLIKVGGDIGIITSQGVALMSQLLDLNVSGQGKVAITNKISGAFSKAYAQAGSKFGWQVLDYPRGSLLIVNVPIVERVTAHQYVMNLDTGAWCRFVNINSGCWALKGNDLFFGGHNGSVYQFDTDYLDDTSSIEFDVQTAFSDFGTPQFKRFTMARPLVRASTGFGVVVDLKVEYDTSEARSTIPAVYQPGSFWDLSTWDEADWGLSSTPYAFWQSIQGIGQVGSVAVSGATAEEFYLNSIDVLYEAGGFL